MEGLELLLSFGLGLLAVIGIFLIFSYILNGLFYSKVAKEHGVPNTWMAWVPWVNTYYHGTAEMLTETGVLLIYPKSFQEILSKEERVNTLMACWAEDPDVTY